MTSALSNQIILSNVSDRSKIDGKVLAKWPVVYMLKVKMMFIKEQGRKWRRLNKRSESIVPSYLVRRSIKIKQAKI